jgi:hypothetical protein
LTKLSVPAGSPAENARFTALLTAEGKPLAGQKVSFAGVSAVTDANGKAEFRAGRAGSFRLAAETAGSYIRPAALTIRVKAAGVPPAAVKPALIGSYIKTR